MEYKYLKYPASIAALAEELSRVVDDYKGRWIGNDDLREIVEWYAQEHPEKLFSGGTYNITMQRKLGKRRLQIIDKTLAAYKAKSPHGEEL